MRTLLMALGAMTLVSCISNDADQYPFPDGEGPIGKGDAITNLPVVMNPPIAGVFDQQIDHPRAPGASLGTFKQRFWYSTEFAKSESSPVLFYFCGEAPCDPAYALTMADAAKALDAAVVVLEHRYYGESKPYPDLTLDHMRYLTIHNALEDAATFEAYAKTALPLKGKWIAVGGSYPGMLAAFYREKHPDLVAGAWASSAPVNVQLSFSGYDAIAANALGPTCTLLFQQVLQHAGTLYDDPAQRDAFSTRVFGAPAPATKTDFLETFSYYASDAAQYGRTRQLCAAMMQDTDPVEGFIEYLHPPLVGSDPGIPVVPGAGGPAPRGAIIPRLVAPTAIDDFTGSEWFYQVCTEVGFYQIRNVDRTQSIMSDLVTQQYWANQCQDYVRRSPAIDATRSEFVDALDRGDVSNVLFVNGSVDPWMALSYTDSSAPAGLSTLVVKTGSHCEDLAALTPDSVLGVFKAHKLFHDLAVQWTK